jgi:hypothetical protein
MYLHLRYSSRSIQWCFWLNSSYVKVENGCKSHIKILPHRVTNSNNLPESISKGEDGIRHKLKLSFKMCIFPCQFLISSTGLIVKRFIVEEFCRVGILAAEVMFPKFCNLQNSMVSTNTDSDNRNMSSLTQNTYTYVQYMVGERSD